MNRHYIVELSTDERAGLEALLQGGTLSARKMKRAQILLMSYQILIITQIEKPLDNETIA